MLAECHMTLEASAQPEYARSEIEGLALSYLLQCKTTITCPVWLSETSRLVHSEADPLITPLLIQGKWDMF
jgi:hypothetical protein